MRTQYGGNAANTVTGQLTAMANHIQERRKTMGQFPEYLIFIFLCVEIMQNSKAVESLASGFSASIRAATEELLEYDSGIAPVIPGSYG